MLGESVIIVVKVEVLLGRPVAELVEEDLASTVLIDGSELGRWVLDWSDPLFDNILGIGELIDINSPITSLVDLLECLPVLKSLSEGAEEDSELSPLDVVCSILAAGNCVLGELEGSHDGWFGIEDLINADHISHTLVDLSEGGVPIAVVVNGAPHLLTFGLLFGVGFVGWQFGTDLFPVDGFHIFLVKSLNLLSGYIFNAYINQIQIHDSRN